MLRILAETWHARDLLRALTEREIKVRYRRSVLGFLWSLLTPLYQVALLTIVVKYLWHNPTPNYSVKLLCALLPWTYFQQSVLTSCPSILMSRAMVKGMYFPRHMLPMAVVGSGLFHFVVSLGVLAIILLMVPVHFHIKFLLLIPLMVIETVMVAGLALLASALHTFFHDVEFILGNLLSAVFFLTPVIWTLDWVPRHLAPWVMLNPMATVCEGFRSVIIRDEGPGLESTLIAAGFALLCFVVGAYYFRAREWQFPEVI
jgi:ABC-2 type transport system permease protein